MKEKRIEVFFVCPMCGKEHSLKNIPETLVDRVENRRQTGEYIQDILKDFSKFDREKFITGYCDKCQEQLFGCNRDD